MIGNDFTPARSVRQPRRALPRWIKEEVRERHYGDCECCKMWCRPIGQFHHIVGVGRGGGDDTNNLAFLCPNCHAFITAFQARTKGDEHFAGMLGAQLREFAYMDEEARELLTAMAYGDVKLVEDEHDELCWRVGA